MNLVIVESPAKAKTINKYLGNDYTVLASYGHVRDLPSKNGSVDPENKFKMIWEVDSFSKKYLKEITDAAKDSNKIILATGSMVGYAYAMEFFMAWYSGNMYESFVFVNRAFGPYWWAYWIMVSCNVITPQIFWFKKARTSIVIMFTASLLVNVGMWFERFVIVVTSLANDFLPSSWGMYEPTWVDVLTFLGSFGLFMTFFLLFIRFLQIFQNVKSRANLLAL